MSSNVEDFNIVPIQEVGSIKWNFDFLKMELEEILKPYKGLVYTENTIKDAKKDRAKLNKLKKEIQGKQKQCKDACLNPYKDIEPKIKELIEMVEMQSMQVDSCVKSFEEKVKEEKRCYIKSYYNSKARPLGDLAERLYPKIYNVKWENATVTAKKYEEDIVIAVNNAISDLKKIEGIKSPFHNELVDTYCNTLSFEDAVKKNDELMEVLNKVNISRYDILENAPVKEVVEANEESKNLLDEHMVKIKAKPNQMQQILDFIKIIGAEYEEI